jgi:two-component system, NtrC family, response regulator PilR
MGGRVLVVDDDLSLRQFLKNMLRRAGYEIEVAGSGAEGLRILDAKPADVVVTDLTMEGMDGMAVLRAVKKGWPATEVIMITAHATAENAVEAMKQGAHDYVVKPFNVESLKVILQKAFEKKAMREENLTLREALKDRFGYGSMVGSSEAMQRVYDLMDRVKDTPVTVLITGESGTGKELVARAVHYEGNRQARPFRSINCGAIPENLIESELFGYKKGAFTGAVRDNIGLFASAGGGTVFLDEVGEMPMSTQVKVLRAIQERKVKPIGGFDEVAIDVRLVAATNRDLAAEVRAGRFREDLYYRLKVVSIELPPLRDRLADVQPLCEHFLNLYGERFGKPGARLDAETRAHMLAWEWPGNVRELENVIQRGIALSHGIEITTDCLPPEIQASGPDRSLGLPIVVTSDGLDLEAVLENYERMLLESALEQAGGVKKEAARLLGVSFRSLRYRLEKIGLEES